MANGPNSDQSPKNRTKLGVLVINLQAQDALPQVETSLSILQVVMSIVSKYLNLTKQLSSKELTDEQADTLIEKVGEMIAVMSSKVEMLQAAL